MIPIVSFIGWQNSGKTTIVREVIARLRAKGLRVAAIKSTHHRDIPFDQPGTDTAAYREAGGQTVALLAPDQMVIIRDNPELKLVDLAFRYFSDCDIVIGEGFKNEHHIAKIEVAQNPDKLLRSEVSGVIGVITDQPVSGENIFSPDQADEVAEFIVGKFLAGDRETQTVMYVNNRKVPLKGFIQEALAGMVGGFIQTLKQTDAMQDIDIRIRLKKNE
ncbi:MAG TPA: molybdopterin-guanine dinucleotide biosynthesis protein B [Desulfobulbaceae bacterium]|nr:molybdopterin-guanine dinucleotide biosynthesis protein B [Desulfobulbaceae bacterium]